MYALVDSIRNPEYTGANRCIPCTIVNTVLALGLAAVATLVATPLVGVVVLAAALAAIALRGYLVPGTPELTQRYMPDWLLAYFDKHPRPVFDAESFDTESFLLEAGVIVEDSAADDVVLAPDFETAWYDRMARIGSGETDRDELAELVDVDPDAFEIDWYGDAFVASVGPEWIGKWESRAAFVADMAAAREIESRYARWRDIPLRYRSQILGGLRLFVERCPTCDGRVELGQNVVKSCCRSYDVVAVTCTDCDARLLEADFDASMLADEHDGAGEVIA